MISTELQHRVADETNVQTHLNLELDLLLHKHMPVRNHQIRQMHRGSPKKYMRAATCLTKCCEIQSIL